jgi:hypothetical protein
MKFQKIDHFIILDQYLRANITDCVTSDRGLARLVAIWPHGHQKILMVFII